MLVSGDVKILDDALLTNLIIHTVPTVVEI
jgi:hypothetical protein